MKRQGILHAELSREIARLGHTDRFVIGDSGLPLPRTVPVIDLALVPGQLDFRTVLDAVLSEVVVQRHIVAAEADSSPAGGWIAERGERLGEQSRVDHDELKSLIAGCCFAVRTGEQTPYANVILEAGVPF
ncbi:MAG: D-ribose pyranase [Micrococcales bacterium]|nr:D-ribose pyranase [Micrococcales bacterium]